MVKIMSLIALMPDVRLSRIKLLCCDVDGVMTDGGLYYQENGNELRKFSVYDGHGVNQLKKENILFCMISHSSTLCIKKRAENLKADFCYLGVEDKLVAIQLLCKTLKLDIAREVAHIADDINDLPLLQAAGVAICVPNAVDDVKKISCFSTKAKGGHGAVREVSNIIVQSKKMYSSLH